MFHGLGHESTRALCGYSVLEGVAFALADGLAALHAAGTEVQRLSLVGGGARSALWAQLIADVLQVEIVVHAGSDAGGALGAARLGWMATGGDAAAVCRKPEVAARYQPNPSIQNLLQERLQRFREIYRRLQTLTPLRSVA